ncbi:MAG TPA: NADH-ubiquinone oxidoreductase-F iron-sulfur binding region domain-containing protein [Spirochaetia bacterium]|nr:NADH-ubiquinone oxidoreductase-F iron-sulfur binding region domain-containing protein [Spirochaetia bacterium]
MSAVRFITKFTEAEDPLDLRAYESAGGFSGLKAALAGSDEAVVETIRTSGLRGRGGAGFPTGIKWGSVSGDGDRYLVCNADEGEPGTFKDRYVLEKAPYLLLEGMAIAAYATGAHSGFIYVRGEYPKIARSLGAAIASAAAAGYLGSKIAGSSFSFVVEVRKGGGSYVVGDETALLNSLMGNRGYPLLKPPFPTEKGLWGKPTIVNNVETLAYVPFILTNGPNSFSQVGTPECPGPKLFSVSGHVRNPGVYEFPMGTTVREVLDAAGGVIGTLKAVQIGGTAGPVYNVAALDYRLDFASLRKIGGALGSGALVFMNTTVNMAQVLEVSMRFFAEESCGQCFPCRYGTRQLDFMAHQIAAGRGRAEYLNLIRETSRVMVGSSFCPFGQSIALPVASLLEGFGEEIVSFVKQQQFLKEVG